MHKGISAIFLFASATACMPSEQAYFTDNSQWKVDFDNNWDVLGPFPIHAREQHFLSPAFPLNLYHPINYSQSWFSSYADGGFVKWTKATSSQDGNLEISFPEIRWKNLRATEGWAGLQHHAVLRTTITLYPPSSTAASDGSPQLLVNLAQASYFTLRPQDWDISSFVPEWCAGNIYDIERALPHVVDLPAAPSLSKPTKYDLFVSGDYEIRLFGDPLVQHSSDIPIQKISLGIQFQDTSSSLVHQASQDVTCDFLDGYAFGDAIGIGIQSMSQWWTARDIELKSAIPGMSLKLQTAITIAPSQTRILPIIIEQTTPYFGENIAVDITFVSGGFSSKVSVFIPVVHRQMPSPERQYIRATFFFANSMPSLFIAIPPTIAEDLGNSKAPPILALHGAGVDVLSQDFWAQALPDNKASWLIVPTGRTSWGLDWHGPSADDAWSSLQALKIISRKRIHEFHKSWEIPPTSQAIVIGHSNGGQGTWYLASRHPDRVLAAVPAAAYIKSQAYIPLTLARSARFIDPSLRSILESSLTPDDNDLHISNLVDTPILAIHGGDDENVPVWHTREATAALKTWYPSANITFREDPGAGHWYSYVLQNPEVQDFLDNFASSSSKSGKSDSFTLTVTVPRESGSLHGWRVDKLMIPGRLARLHVRKINDTKFEVKPSNIHTFTVPIGNGVYEIYVDNAVISIPNTEDPIQVSRISPGKWESKTYSEILQSPGRMQAILSSPGPVILVISEQNRHELSVALRLAHILNVYHKLDAEIVTDVTALHWNKLGLWPSGNIVFIGTPSSPFAKEILRLEKTGTRIIGSMSYVGTRKFNGAGQAVLFLHPHPMRDHSLMMFILYTDKPGLERAMRLFPFRTGVAVPDWLVVGDKMDTFGAGGIEAAGVWDGDWKLSDYLSWFYH